MALVAPMTAGCGPAVPEEELGTVVFEVPYVPAEDEPGESPEPPSTAPAETGATPANDSESADSPSSTGSRNAPSVGHIV